MPGPCRARSVFLEIDRNRHHLDQMSLYGLGGRGWSQVQGIVTTFLSNLWFDAVPDLSPATVERMLQSPREFLFLNDDERV